MSFLKGPTKSIGLRSLKVKTQLGIFFAVPKACFNLDVDVVLRMLYPEEPNYSITYDYKNPRLFNVKIGYLFLNFNICLILYA